jgi:hypothetical protein
VPLAQIPPRCQPPARASPGWAPRQPFGAWVINGHGKLCQDASCPELVPRWLLAGSTFMRAWQTRSSGMRVRLLSPLLIGQRRELGWRNLNGWELGGRAGARPPRGGEERVTRTSVFIFVSPLLSSTSVFRELAAPWRDPGVWSKQPGRVPDRPWGAGGDPGRAGGKRPGSGSWEFGRPWALTCRLSSLFLPNPGEAGLASSFSLVPPPNLSETFENKILSVVPQPPS